MKISKNIYFDMDGTLADFYSVENWLSYLDNSDPTPYREAKPLFNFSSLARLLNRLISQDYTINIISWGSKGSTSEFLTNTEQAKKDWLKKHLPSVNFTNIIITPYGVNKSEFMRTKNDILFDDNIEVRRNWEGLAFSEKDILSVLKALTH